MNDTIPLTMRIPTSVAQRADNLLEWASQTHDLAPTGRATRTALLRRALLIGLSELEDRAKKDPKP